ncbi:MAG: hypothetical protein GX335_01685 [Firmicutes bacterium]|nr:hypothetical protein [Bacillota bacterium]
MKKSTFNLIGVFSLLLTARLIYFLLTQPQALTAITRQAPVAVLLTLAAAFGVDLVRTRLQVGFFWRAAAYFVITFLLHYFIHLDFSYFTSPVLAVGLFLPEEGRKIDLAATALTLAGIALAAVILILRGQLIYTILLSGLYALSTFLI